MTPGGTETAENIGAIPRGTGDRPTQAGGSNGGLDTIAGACSAGQGGRLSERGEPEEDSVQTADERTRGDRSSASVHGP